MAERKKRRMIRRVFSSYAFLFLLFVILLFSLRGLWNVFTKYQAAEGNSTSTAQTLEELKTREAQLSDQVELLETEHGLETEIRERFNVAKENEGVIYIVDNESATRGNVQEAEKTEPQDPSFFGKIRAFFSGETVGR